MYIDIKITYMLSCVLLLLSCCCSAPVSARPLGTVAHLAQAPGAAAGDRAPPATSLRQLRQQGDSSLTYATPGVVLAGGAAALVAALQDPSVSEVRLGLFGALRLLVEVATGSCMPNW